MLAQVLAEAKALLRSEHAGIVFLPSPEGASVVEMGA